MAIAQLVKLSKIGVGVDVVRWRPWSSKSVGGCEQQASVGSTPILSRIVRLIFDKQLGKVAFFR